MFAMFSNMSGALLATVDSDSWSFFVSHSRSFFTGNNAEWASSMQSIAMSPPLYDFVFFIMCYFVRCLCCPFTGVSVEKVFLSSLALFASRQLVGPQLSTFPEFRTESWVFCFVIVLQIWPFKMWNDVIAKQTDTGYEGKLEFPVLFKSLIFLFIFACLLFFSYFSITLR